MQTNNKNEKRQPLIYNELAFISVLPQGLEPWTH